MTPDEYCQKKAAASGSSFYYSFLFLPPERRRAITALYAFCREVDDVVDECREPAVARVKLDWWREQVGKMYAGEPDHPVCKALAPCIKTFDLPEEQFREIIDGMQMDLDYDAYPSFTELSLYCYRVASVVGLMSAQIFGYEDHRTARYAHDLGMAFQLTNILRDVLEDARRGRIYIPLDELKRFEIDPMELQRAQTSERLQALFAFQAERARDYYRRAFSHLPAVDRHTQRSGIIMAAIYQTLLDEIEADGFHVLERRVALTPLRKLWIAWRTVRSEKRHTKALKKV